VKWEWRKRVKKKGGLVRKDPFFETQVLQKNIIFFPPKISRILFFLLGKERKKQI